MAYLAAAVEPYNPVKIIDLNVQPFEVLKDTLREWEPTHIGMSIYTPNNISSMKVLEGVHEQYPNIITIVGGPHEVFRGQITKKLFPWINHVVVDRKGENALVEIMTGENKNIDWKKLFPAYHLLDMLEESYQFDFKLFDGKKMIQYMSSRGCNMGCVFCGADEYAELDNDIVIEHLYGIKQMGYTALFFNDVNFISSVPRTADLMKKIIKNRLNLKWGCQTALTDMITPELLRLMAKAGCSYIAFSVENVSPDALWKLGKQINPEYVKDKAMFAKSIGIKIGAYVIFGIHKDPEEDFFWAEQTLNRIEEISPDYVSYSILADYPSANPNLPYETVEYGVEEIWDFFDEGRAFHPYCSVKHAERLRDEINRKHKEWPNIRTF
ncbi:MAG: radical SAM protein [Patescibacteria group bacterium]|nr:radical SAM protein [Patescibacteria group bacterium]